MQINSPEYKLLSVLQHYAPTGKDQQIVSDMMNGIPPEHQARTLAGMIFDGLTFGNWPWTDYTKYSTRVSK
jgi:hypothetical protein